DGDDVRPPVSAKGCSAHGCGQLVDGHALSKRGRRRRIGSELPAMDAYILIGGESRRMGRSKTELFFDRVAAAAAEVFEDVIAVQRHGGPAAPLATIYE